MQKIDRGQRIADAIEDAFAEGMRIGAKHAELLDEALIAGASKEFSRAYRAELARKTAGARL